MNKNFLFNAVTNKTALEKTISHGITLSLRTHSEGTPYYFFALPEQATTVAHYTLHDHHVSVFADLEGKSQYHYTAQLKNQAGDTFRLHIYFNDRDGYASLPLLSQLNEDYTVSSDVACEEYHEAFKALAHMSIDGLISQLRKDQKELIALLKATYMTLEKDASALSQNLEHNMQAYQVNLTLQIATLEKLGLYTDLEHSKLVYLRKLNRALELSIAGPSLIRAESQESIESEPDSTAGILAQLSEAAGSKPARKKAELAQEIAELQAQIKAIAQLGLEQTIVAIRAAQERLSLIEFELDASISFKELHDLRALRMSLDAIGGKLLLQLLRDNKYQEAEALAPFYHLIPEWMTPLALGQNNAKLLDFLLKNNLIPLPYTNFSIQQKQYASMVDYFMQQATTVKTPTMIDCLDVLIKHGISLMGINKNTGLPFAAQLMDINHPLQEALHRNKEATLVNRLFCQQLNQLLRVIAAQPACSLKNKALIEHLINKNQIQLEQKACFAQLPGSGILNKAQEKLVSNAEEALGAGLVKQIQADSEIIALRKRINQRAQLFLNSLPRHLRPQISMQIRKYTGNISEMMQGLKKIGYNFTFKELKQQILERLHKTSHDLDDLNEYFDIQKKLKGSIAYKNTPTKKQKQLVARSNQLIERFEEMTRSDELTRDLFTSCVDIVTKTKSRFAQDEERLDLLDRQSKALDNAIGALTDILNLVKSMNKDLFSALPEVHAAAAASSASGAQIEVVEEDALPCDVADFLSYATKHGMS